MAFYFYKGKKIVKVNGQKEQRYVARAHVMGTISEKDLAEKLSKSLSLEGPEVLLLLDELADQILTAAMQGQSVKVDGLGTFRPTFQCSGSESPDDVTDKNIKKVKINFRPDTNLKKDVSEVSRKFYDEVYKKHI